jgi:hypothetical protein
MNVYEYNSCVILVLYGGVAQIVKENLGFLRHAEWLVHSQQVVGANPTPASTI